LIHDSKKQRPREYSQRLENEKRAEARVRSDRIELGARNYESERRGRIPNQRREELERTAGWSRKAGVRADLAMDMMDSRSSGKSSHQKVQLKI
jgi:hypothetical protein